MLFMESDLNINNGLAMLEEATYLSENESLINPATIPVKEVSRLGYGVVRFDDVDKLSEDYGPEYLAVSVPEEDIIAYPEIVNELANIVVQPLSEYDPEYQYVAECVSAWIESGDEEYLEYLTEYVTYDNKTGKPDFSHASDEEVRQYQRIQYAQQHGAMGGRTGGGARTTAAIQFGRAQDEVERRAKIRQERAERNASTPEESLDVRLARYKGRKQGKAEAQAAQAKIDQAVQNAQSAPAASSNISLTRPGKKVHHEKPSMFQRVKAAPGAFAGAMKGYGNILSGKTQITGSNGEQLSKFQMLKQHAAANKGATAAAGLGAAALVGGGIYAYKQYKNKPKSVIGKRIAALRGVYKKFMMNAQRNPQKAGMFKRMAAKILSVIDKLMGYLQNAAG